MHTALYVIGSVAIIVFTAAFVILAAGILKEIRKLGKASEDLSRVLNTLENEVTPAIKEVRTTVGNVDQLVSDVDITVRRVDKVAVSVEGLMHNALIGSTAAKAIKSSTTSLISVYEGVKQGIKTLRGS